MKGGLTSAGDIQIDGYVEGDVRSIGLVIGEKAEIHGEILAEDVTVRGRVIGRIRARKILLAATSHVEGDILHEAFAVETGPSSKAIRRHSDNPLGRGCQSAKLCTAARKQCHRHSRPSRSLSAGAEPGAASKLSRRSSAGGPPLAQAV